MSTREELDAFDRIKHRLPYVDIPTEKTMEKINGMQHTRRDLWEWYKENIKNPTPLFCSSDVRTKISRFHFYEVSDAVLFKLVWG